MVRPMASRRFDKRLLGFIGAKTWRKQVQLPPRRLSGGKNMHDRRMAGDRRSPSSARFWRCSSHSRPIRPPTCSTCSCSPLRVSARRSSFTSTTRNRPAVMPQEINGKPNYQLRTHQIRQHRRGILGHRGFPGRPDHRPGAGLPDLSMGLPWINFGRLRPLHTSAVIFAFGGNVLLSTSLYVVQRTCRARTRGRARALVRRSRLQPLHRHRRHGLPARHHPVQGICRAGMVCRPLADHRLG